jgi:membrane fusion protein (multidrug efflux system)
LAAAFSRTLRAISNDGSRRAVLWLLSLLVLAALWLGWFLLAPIGVVATSERARLEVAREVHEVQAPTAGRVVATHLVLGRELKAGDVLIELDSEIDRLRLEEERKKGAAAQAQLEALRAEIAAQERWLSEKREATAAAAAEAEARAREAIEEARLADKELERIAPLRSQGLVSDADVQRARSLATRRRAAAEALSLGARRVSLDERVEETQASARMAGLRREEARLRGLADASNAAAATLALEIERCEIRAPVAGRLGRAASPQIGGYLKAGEFLGAIVPRGELRAVAEYLPQEALGRVKPGQQARLRLDGFAWTQYGSLPATVTTVGNETRDGRIRIELAVQSESRTSIPLEHGLPGALEIEIERVPPAVLVLRGAAGLFAPRPSSAMQAADARH